MKPRGMVVCVNYDDLLKITLLENISHFSECCVITSMDDDRTLSVASQFENVVVFRTDAFYRQGAKFNKGLAIEEAFDFFGRRDWMLIWDADIVFPAVLDFSRVAPGNLYGATRRILENPEQYKPGINWKKLPASHDRAVPGYFQLFHAGDAALQKTPWYDTSFTHAGGGDAFFHDHWKKRQWKRIASEVLHLGPRNMNWFGRLTDRLDGIDNDDVCEKLKLTNQLHKAHGWARTLSVDMSGYNDRVPEHNSKYDWHNSRIKWKDPK